MAWCLCKNRYVDTSLCETNVKELKRKELEVKLKENKVNKKAKLLKRRIKELEKLSENKAKKDLAAAAKLDQARNKFLKVLYSNKNFKKCECHANKKKKRDKSKRKSKSTKHAGVDILHNFFDKYFKMDKNVSNLMKINSHDFVDTFKRILLQPYTGTYPSYKMTKYGRRSLNEHRNGWNPSPSDCYLMTLRKTPQVWIYDQWPRFYPHYLSFRAQCKNCRFLFMILLGFFLWIPCFICLELCQCLICCCCSDQ